MQLPRVLMLTPSKIQHLFSPHYHMPIYLSQYYNPILSHIANLTQPNSAVACKLLNPVTGHPEKMENSWLERTKISG